MKDWKDIEKMDPGQLGKAAAGTPVPEGWENRLTDLVGRLDEGERILGKARTRRPMAWIAVSAAAAAVLAAAVLFRPDRTPDLRDTYDDPALAYAEVEKALGLIAATMQYGSEKVSESCGRIGQSVEAVLK